MGAVAGASVPLEALALGALDGLAYGLAAVGLIFVFRFTGSLNLAHGAIGAAAAGALFAGIAELGLPYWPAFVAALGVGAVLGALIERIVARRLAGAPGPVLLVATLAAGQVLLGLGAATGVAVGPGEPLPQPPGVPGFSVGTLVVGPSAVALLFLGPLAIAGLWALLHRTALGAQLRASASHPAAARTLGVPAARFATLAWALAGALAALSAALLLPTGVAAGGSGGLGLHLLVRALAAAAVARMERLPVALAAGVALGIFDQAVAFNTVDAGARDAVLFAAVLAALLARPLPDAAAGLSRERTGGWHAGRHGELIVLAFAVAALAPRVLPDANVVTLSSVAVIALTGLSAWLLAGPGGMLSVGQVAFAGVGAVAAVRVAELTGSPVAGMLAAPACGAAAAVIVGLPALRRPGQALTVTTLAFALAATTWLLPREWALGDGAALSWPALQSPSRAYVAALAALAAGLAAVVVVSRGSLGRRMRALRDDPAAARAIGVRPLRTRLQAFALAGALAGLAGAALTLVVTSLSAASFTPAAGFQAAAVAVLGGLAGPAWVPAAALYVVGLPELAGLSNLAAVGLSVTWLSLLLLAPQGLAGLARRRPPDPQTSSGKRQAPPPPDPRPLAERGRPLLVGVGLVRRFGSVTVLEGVDIEVRAGEMVAVVGPNGAGKTTLLDVLSGAARPDGGRVLLGGTDVTAWAPERRARAGLVRGFDEPAPYRELTPRDLVLLGLERAGRAGDDAAGQLARFGLAEVAGVPVTALSTGLRRLADLAALTAGGGSVLLLDEPTAGLARPEAAAVMRLLAELRDEQGMAIVIVEHDRALAGEFADRVVALREDPGPPPAVVWSTRARSADSPRLVVRGLAVDYPGKRAVVALDLVARPGEIVALTGTNGAGKSSVLRAIAGLVEPSAGSAEIEGRDLGGLRAEQRAAMAVALVGPPPWGFPDLTVAESLRLAADRACSTPYDASALLGDLVDRPRTRVRTLSAGQRRRLVIATALIRRPKLLLLDELTASLSGEARDMVLQEMVRLAGEGSTIVVADGTLSAFAGVAHSCLFLEHGEVRFEGAPPELLARGDLLRSLFVGTPA